MFLDTHISQSWIELNGINKNMVNAVVFLIFKILKWRKKCQQSSLKVDRGHCQVSQHRLVSTTNCPYQDLSQVLHSVHSHKLAIERK